MPRMYNYQCYFSPSGWKYQWWTNSPEAIIGPYTIRTQTTEKLDWGHCTLEEWQEKTENWERTEAHLLEEIGQRQERTNR